MNNEKQLTNLKKYHPNAMFSFRHCKHAQVIITIACIVGVADQVRTAIQYL